MKSNSRKTKIISLLLSFVAALIIIITVVWFTNRGAGKRDQSLSGINSKTIDGQIAVLSQAVEDNPAIISNYVSLSEAYLQKIRETADVSYYQKISDLTDKAEKIDPKNADVPALRASVELGRHHFKEAEEYAKNAIALSPQNHFYYGLLGDSQIELGQYEKAAESFQKMVDLRPDYSSYIRIAYIRELYGDIDGAKQALQKSIEFGSGFKENIAFAYVELGKLNMRANLDQAASNFSDGIKVLPEYAPALEGLGKVAFFKKDTAADEKYFMDAYTALPIVQYAVDLGDFYFATGNTVKANQYYTLAELAFESSAKSGVSTELEESLYLSDHDMKLDRALDEAKKAYAARPSVYAADYLSWALYKNNQPKESVQYTKEAMRLGEIDPLILFHQGMIAIKNGDIATGKKYLNKSLKINPYFSILDSEIAKQILTTVK